MTALEPTALLAALLAAVTAASATGMLVRRPRRVAARLRPYSQLARSRLGLGDPDARVLALPDHARRGPIGEVLAPFGERLARGFGRLIDAGDRRSVELRLAQAGFAETTADQYRMRQLAWAGAGAATGAATGLLAGVSAAAVLALSGLAAYSGATRWRSRVDRAIRDRRAAMRAELPTVAQLLAVYVRTGHGPVEAVREVTARRGGMLAGDLVGAIGWIQGGTAPGGAYERLARVTPEPLAARLYRMLGAATVSGGDIASSLLALASDARAERREELARAAIRRRSAMLLPLLVLIAPTMLLFVAAPLPHVIFGS